MSRRSCGHADQPLFRGVSWPCSLELHHTRGLAGKPLAGFCTTPNGRITVVYGVIVYVIRFKNPSLHR